MLLLLAREEGQSRVVAARWGKVVIWGDSRRPQHQGWTLGGGA